MSNRKNLQNRATNRWIIFVWVLVIALIIFGSGAGKPRLKPKVVGILCNMDAFAHTADGFISGMTKLGYIEGKNIIYKVYKIQPDPVKEREVIDKFITDKVDLIFAFPTGPALLAKTITRGKGIPVVFAIASTENNNLIKTIREPGGNITGIRFPGEDLALKRLEILLEMAPRTKRIWMAYQFDYPSAVNALKALRPVASSLGITLVKVPLKGEINEIKSDLQARDKLDDIGIDAIFIMPEPLAQTPESWKLISEFAAKHRLPVTGAAAFAVNQGAIFTYIPDDFETGEMAAHLADHIFKGVPAGKIPVLTPEPRLRINYKLAKELGLNVSEELLSQAYEIIP